MQAQDDLRNRLSPDRAGRLANFLVGSRVSLVSCAYWRNRAPWGLEPRRCTDCFLLLPTVGAVDLDIRGKVIRLSAGSCLVLPDYELHGLQIAEGTTELEQVSLHCHAWAADGKPLAKRFVKPVMALPSPAYWLEALQDLASLLAREPRAGEVLGEALVRGLFAALVTAGEPLQEGHAIGDVRIARALDYLTQHYAADLSVSQLAAEATVSEAHFRKLFAAELGSSPRRFLIGYRLERAAALLTASRLTVKEIASQVGFHSDHYFHRCFRSHFGCTPSAYRATACSSV